MTMWLILGYGAFFLCFSTITANLGEGDEQDCPWNVTEEALEKDEYLRDGKQHILDKLLVKVQSYYGKPSVYNFQVDVPELQYCLEELQGLTYNFFWKKENFTIDCTSDNDCGTLHGVFSNNVICLSTYFVDPKDGFKHFQEPNCKREL